MRTFSKVILIAFSFAIFISCKKNTEEPPQGACSGENTYIFPQLYDLKFKANTFWVYTDSVTLSTDCTFVTSVVFDGMTMSSNCHLYQDEKYVFLTSPLNPITNRNDDYIVIGNTFIRNNSPGIFTLWLTNAGIISNAKDSVFIFDRFYKNVQITTKENDGDEGGLKTTYYVNSDFGILRKDVFNSNGSLKSKKLLIRKISSGKT